LIYRLTDDQNLRLSWSKTIARPSFKELSFAQIFDPITGRSFIGGLSPDRDEEKGVVYWDGNLVSTDIQNFDLRWELFQPGGQTVSLSAFYKTFKNPIEIVQFVSNKGSFQPRNVGDGQVTGGEIELRQSMKVLGESLKNLTLMVNYTYIRSKIEMSDSEYDSRLDNARTGEVIKDTRDMAGQAPYLINAGLTYDGNGGKGFAKGLDAGLFYNVQGKTLQYVGINDLPDVYSKPFHSLNFNMTKVLGAKERFQLGFKVENLLGAERESVYQSYQAADQYFERRSPGTKFEFKLSYSLY
jgi:outer membrane receptor protein involved in Fe transport